MMLALYALNRDEGTIVVFEAFDPATRGEKHYLVAVEHRAAQDLVDTIEAGEAPVCEIEAWQILGRINPRP